ncbi:McrB family protein [Herbaspirillum sp. alder98]|uniref:McrB family protein n=1 Tax=Herbaspirillum sp. alder98 TaxID=2913096 RepID=UPI001CD82874|nr:AAA family ATPase [Herbaspirillum sp. alder98]MCA1323745.1 AAA family ATPase [Herbaspirillum sp. alder98]
MLDDYLNDHARILFDRLSEADRQWAQLVIEVLRLHYPMADHWTTGGPELNYIDIRVGQKLHGKSKGRPVMYLKGEGLVSLIVNHRLLPAGADNSLASAAAPEAEQIGAWLDTLKLSDAGRKRLDGTGSNPIDYNEADNVPDEDEIDDRASYRKQAPQPLNLILYGPPGTGKTYRTILEALRVIEGNPDPQGDFIAQKARFDAFRNEGRIAFVTFHQSFSYEDFIEGIRADTTDGQLSYMLRDGIFKRMAITAMYRPGQAGAGKAELGFDELYDAFLEEVRAGLPYAFKGIQGGDMKIHSVNPRGTFAVVHPGRAKKHSISRKRLKALVQRYPDLAELERQPSSSAAIVDVIGGANVTAYWGVLKSLLKFKEKSGAELLDEGEVLAPDEETDYEQIKQRVLGGDKLAPNGKPYVIIIDEINRANMSRVFGELITLIEPSKRAGRVETTEVMLPYSNDRFSVPSNLYIIGTMNTADRSLAVVDTALRRRFDFIEMMPEPELIKRKSIGDIDLVKMLRVINQRIEYLYDREHTIGHSFFMELNEESSLDDLARIFRNNVLPLLEEYFFEDWEKISKVLGNARIYEPQSSSDLGFSHGGKVYRRNLDKLRHTATYRAIYGSAEETLTKAADDPDA